MACNYILCDSNEPSIWSLIDGYRELVLDCREGYSWSSQELMNDMHVRDRIELVIRNGNSNDEAIGAIIGQVNEIDEMLKELFQDGISVMSKSDKWYYNGVLKYAGQQYIECMKAHGIHVELI